MTKEQAVELQRMREELGKMQKAIDIFRDDMSIMRAEIKFEKERRTVAQDLLERTQRNLERVCYVAVNHGVISRTVCADMLGISMPALEKWIAEYKFQPVEYRTNA